MSIRLIAGDCRDVLATLPADSVHCVVTSPPYYGLRDYGTALWDGGAAACDHRIWGHAAGKPTPGGRGGSMPAQEVVQREHCSKCGAARIDRQIGLEATPEAYLQTMVQVFREVKRVLRPDGTCWVNQGDLFVNKQLQMMPARFALALQADGWILRSSIIWHKPNPMPESCTDRPTSAHEHVFLLTRSARYYYDADAVREPHEGPNAGHIQRHNSPPTERGDARNLTKWTLHDYINPAGRSLRNVWTLATHPYAQAHFATYPPALAERCIRAGTSERGCCAQCGKPWVRVVETTPEYAAVKSQLRERLGPNFHMKRAGTDAVKGVGTGTNPATLPPKHTTTGWQPGCAHDADIVPCTILDPFIGAGTTALVADRLQRDCIGIDLNTAYTQMAMQRCRDDAPLFADLAPVPEPPEDERMADLFEGDEYQRLPVAPKPLQVPRGWDTGPGAHGTIHRSGRTMPDMAAE